MDIIDSIEIPDDIVVQTTEEHSDDENESRKRAKQERLRISRSKKRDYMYSFYQQTISPLCNNYIHYIFDNTRNTNVLNSIRNTRSIERIFSEMIHYHIDYTPLFVKSKHNHD